MNLERLQKANICAGVISSLAQTLVTMTTNGLVDTDARIGKELTEYTNVLRELRTGRNDEVGES